MIAAIDRAREAGDTLGGSFEVIAHGVPPGLGSYVQWDRKLDGRLAQALMSIPAIKAVGIGLGVEGAAAAGLAGPRRDRAVRRMPRRPRRCIARPTNRAGGLEGGVTNGEDLRVTGFMKPISTLMKPLRSVDLTTLEEAPAAIERSDVCAVPAAAVVGEAMVALVLADALARALRRRLDAPAARRTSRDTARAIARPPRPARRRSAPRPDDSADPALRRPACCTQPARAGRGASRRRSTTLDRRHDRDDVRGAGHRPGGAAGRRRRCGSSWSTCRSAAIRRRCIVDDQSRVRRARRMQLEEEGCLSVPGFNATVARPQRVVVKGLDRDGAAHAGRRHGPAGARVSARDGSPRRHAVRRSAARHQARSDRAQDPQADARGQMVSGGAALRIVFFGTPAFAVPTLDALLASRHRGRRRRHPARSAARPRPAGVATRR